jgi:hypothetical protein
MFKDHPHLQHPSDDQVIWRYMDFTKFVDMLERNILYFTRADLFADPYEGTYPNHPGQWDKTLLASEIRSNLPQEIRETEDHALRTKKYMLRTARMMRKTVFVNCWYANAGESAAMWQLYLANKNEGVALRSTIGRFKQSIQAAPQKVLLSEVRYIDYKKDVISLRNMYYACTHKRLSFAHEQEVRALYGDQESFDKGVEVIRKNELREVVGDESRFRGFLANSELRAQMGWQDAEFVSLEDWKPAKTGVSIPTDLDQLIDRVFVAPTSEPWFRNLVELVLRRYRHSQGVEKSDLMTDPVW